MQLRTVLAKSKNDAQHVGLLAESASIANGSMGFEQASRASLALVCEANHWDAAPIWYMNDDAALLSGGVWRFTDRTIGSELSTRAAAPSLDLEVVNDPRFVEALEGGPQSTLSWPVEAEGKVDLILEFFSQPPIALDDQSKTLLGHIAVQLGHVRVRGIVRERTAKLVFIDPVTELPNRAGFEHLFAQKLKDVKRRQSQLALMFIDLDGLKRVNDSLGHAVGDRLLKTVGARLK